MPAILFSEPPRNPWWLSQTPIRCRSRIGQSAVLCESGSLTQNGPQGPITWRPERRRRHAVCQPRPQTARVSHRSAQGRTTRLCHRCRGRPVGTRSVFFNLASREKKVEGARTSVRPSRERSSRFGLAGFTDSVPTGAPVDRPVTCPFPCRVDGLRSR